MCDRFSFQFFIIWLLCGKVVLVDNRPVANKQLYTHLNKGHVFLSRFKSGLAIITNLYVLGLD